MPHGYVRTEAGVLPSQWAVERVDGHATIKTGSRNTQDRVSDGEYPFFVRSQQVERIDTYSFDGEAVLTAGDGVGTGKVYHYINGRFDVHQRVYRISDFSDRLNGRYFFYQFSSRFYDRIMSMTAKSSVDSVRMEMIAGMPIPLPPYGEQTRIAEALTDVDELITSLDALIAKKRAIMSATMRQLLSASTRLPGFTLPWASRKLREVADLHRDSVLPRQFGSHLFTHFSLPAHDDGRRPVVEPGSAIGSAKYRVPQDSVLVSKLNPRIPRIWAPSPVPKNAVASTEFLVLTPREGLSRDFLFLLCSSPSFLDQMEASATGTTGSHQRIRPSTALNIEVEFPVDVAEQVAVSVVLSDMDAEITALSDRCDKARAIKQGIMQQLLTGRVRLPDPGRSA